MKKSLRVLGLFVAFSITVTAFIGCGKKADIKAESSTAAPVATKAPVKLSFWGAIAEEMGPKAMVDEFNKIDPRVQVEYVRFTNDDSGNTKLDVTLMSGDNADIFMSYNDALMKKRATSGSARDLTALVKSAGIDLMANYGSDLSAYKIDGKLVQLPTVKGNKVILYNQKMFDDAKIPYPKAGWTYDEFIDAAKKLTKGSGANKVYGYYYPSFDAGQPATEFSLVKNNLDSLYSTDGKTSNLDSADIKNSFEKYMSRVKDGIEPNFVDNKLQKLQPQDMLLKGQAAMVFGGWIVRYVKDVKTYPHDFKVGFATLPKLGGSSQDKLFTTSLSEYVSVNSNCKTPEEAVGFIKWMTEGGWDPMIKLGGKFPASKKYDSAKAAKLAFEGSENLFDMDSVAKVLLGNFDTQIRTNTTAAAEMNTILTEEFEKSFADAQTPDAAMKNAKTRSDEKIKAANK